MHDDLSIKDTAHSNNLQNVDDSYSQTTEFETTKKKRVS
jgi:hypothetical protein